MAVESTAAHFVHFPTFVPSVVQVAGFVVSYEPLKVCPVAGISPVSLPLHLEQVRFFVPFSVQVADSVVLQSLQS